MSRSPKGGSKAEDSRGIALTYQRWPGSGKRVACATRVGRIKVRGNPSSNERVEAMVPTNKSWGGTEPARPVGVGIGTVLAAARRRATRERIDESLRTKRHFAPARGIRSDLCLRALGLCGACCECTWRAAAFTLLERRHAASPSGGLHVSAALRHALGV